VTIEESLIYGCGCRIPLVYHQSGELRLVGNVIGGSWQGICLWRMGPTAKLLLAGNDFRWPADGPRYREVVLMPDGTLGPDSIALYGNKSCWPERAEQWQLTGWYRWPGYPADPPKGYSSVPLIHGPLPDYYRWADPPAVEIPPDPMATVLQTAGCGNAWDTLLKRNALFCTPHKWYAEKQPHWGVGGRLIREVPG
jgi:hypothetical protein